mgnify:CR=1 FL=1
MKEEEQKMIKYEMDEVEEVLPSLIQKKDGVVVIDALFENILDNLESNVAEAENDKKVFKTALLKYMRDHDIYTASTDKYTISQVVPKEKSEFNKEKFIQEQPDDIIEGFSTINEVKVFNEQILKEKYPEIYDECCETQYDVEVDTKKLSKAYPEIFDKYNVIIPATSDVTLRITDKTAKKGKK